LTIDYGPFQFLDQYDPKHVCNHSDHQGRYAFNQQPQVAYWNLFCLGQALMPLIEDSDLAIAALETYKALYARAFARRMAAKLGLPDSSEAQIALTERLLQLLATDAVDYTIFWRRLSHWAATQQPDDDSVRDLFIDRLAVDAWLLSYSELLAQYPRGLEVDLMLKVNPKYVLRNHLGELAIAAAKTKDFSVVDDLLQVLLRPFDEHPAHAAWADFAPDWARQISISCSS
jgi:serine/tyrosine/threonine adenylyltransferase